MRLFFAFLLISHFRMSGWWVLLAIICWVGSLVAHSGSTSVTLEKE